MAKKPDRPLPAHLDPKIVRQPCDTCGGKKKVYRQIGDNQWPLVDCPGCGGRGTK